MQPQRLADLVADRVQRRQRGHRLLKDDRDAPAADRPHLGAVGRQSARGRSAVPSPRGSANRISPWVIWPLRGRMRMIAWLTTDLPEPDSPTSATVERGRTRNDAPLTARINPPGAAKRTCRSRIVEQIAHACPPAIAAKSGYAGRRSRAPPDWPAVAALSSTPRAAAASAARSTSSVEPVDPAVEADRRARRRAARAASSRRAGRAGSSNRRASCGRARPRGSVAASGPTAVTPVAVISIGVTWRSAVRRPKSANSAANPATIAVAAGAERGNRQDRGCRHETGGGAQIVADHRALG